LDEGPDSEEEYIEALLEHRFEEYNKSQEIKDDIYKKEEVQGILANNWIRFVVNSRKKKEEFDITLRNINIQRNMTMRAPKSKDIFNVCQHKSHRETKRSIEPKKQ
jgi:hypothetical protein